MFYSFHGTSQHIRRLFMAPSAGVQSNDPPLRIDNCHKISSCLLISYIPDNPGKFSLLRQSYAAKAAQQHSRHNCCEEISTVIFVRYTTVLLIILFIGCQQETCAENTRDDK